ncbi:protein phosphatase 1 regulatory subunit 21-like isoform X1 [Branchiostoma floridae]|uniref:Protein phosphatase 1 regulatory subunit 21 n=1 Tax=Branchiostoma floridae TaxID=7739 RepID=A0A9J7N6S7_BRAFL|nr:protein phosphatase 1 regulatory subunit 21-like isoform X1 [Branchiostoma floridae]
MASGDIQNKYQRLAQEYAKMKSQHSVLKKAVIDEQSKVAELTESVKLKDLSIRKFEQEIDSLTFRNQQLAKRVTVLQDELDSAAVKKKNKFFAPLRSTTDWSTKGPVEPAPVVADTSVFGEDLQKKIQENERLHMQVHQETEEHRQVVASLQVRLEQLEKEAGQHQSVLDSIHLNHKALVDKLQQEKAMLEVKLQKQETDVRDSKRIADHCQQQLKRVHADLSSRLDDSTKVIQEKVIFNDTKYQELNVLNVPTHDRKHQVKAKELIGQALGYIGDLVSGMSNYLTYAEQRSQIFPMDSSTGEPLSPVNRRLCQYLHENASHLRPIEQSFRSFHEGLREDALTTLETATGIQDFSEKFHSFVAYMEKLLPYQLRSLEEECAVSTCSATLEARNMELHASLPKLTATLSKLDNYLSLIAAASKSSREHPRTNQAAFFTQMAAGLNQLHEVLKEISKHYNTKVSLEHQLPTATQKLKTTDECVVSSLVALVSCTGKLAPFFSSHLEFFVSRAGYRTRGVSLCRDTDGPVSSPVVTDLRDRATSYVSRLKRPCPESVPYKTAVLNRRTLLSSTESREGLAQQLTTAQEKMRGLEQEKEHWMLEAQLLQVRLEKETKRVSQLEVELRQLQAGQVVTPAPPVEATQTASPGDRKSVGSDVETSLLGKLESSVADESSESETREQLIKAHFTGRVTELTTQLQQADSKAVNFHSECRALQQRLGLAEKAKEKFQEELQTAQQKIAQLQDELTTTTSNYESQLSMMSEHLCSMNDKLTQQRDEIDALKLSNKGSKKGKGR